MEQGERGEAGQRQQAAADNGELRPDRQGQNGAATAPTSAKATASSSSEVTSAPPARAAPGHCWPPPEATRSTAIFDASPSRPGRIVSRNEPTELAAKIEWKHIRSPSAKAQASARSGYTRAEIA